VRRRPTARAGPKQGLAQLGHIGASADRPGIDRSAHVARRYDQLVRCRSDVRLIGAGPIRRLSGLTAQANGMGDIPRGRRSE